MASDSAAVENRSSLEELKTLPLAAVALGLVSARDGIKDTVVLLQIPPILRLAIPEALYPGHPGAVVLKEDPLSKDPNLPFCPACFFRAHVTLSGATVSDVTGSVPASSALDTRDLEMLDPPVKTCALVYPHKL